MKNGKTWTLRLIPILLVALTTFSACATVKSAPDAKLKKVEAALVPPMPKAPDMEPVRFVDRDGGLWLSYDDYRALERNVIALREYIAKLENILEFYKGD